MALKESIELLDPRKITDRELPLIVMVDNRREFLGWVIKYHTKANWNHICEMHKIGTIVSQDPIGFREVPIESYMKNWITMKFWSYSQITILQKQMWLDMIQAELDAPWMTRQYDWLGIIGMALGIPALQNSHKKYCSERVATHLQMALKFDIKEQITPNAINEYFKPMPEMKTLGYWFEK